ncbi:MAG: class I SAM-dependent methyltransferase, partial [Candidatus Micrarchaeia archaeon]
MRLEKIKITPMPNTQEAVERRAHDNKAEDFHHILAAVKTFAPKGPLSVLSLGSGFGQVAQALGMHRCRTANLDYSFKLLSTGKKQPHNYLGTNFINADAKSIPFKDKTFDIVVSGHFLHSGLADTRKDEEKMLQEAHRCLKPGGLLVLDRANSSAASEKKLEESGF